jgi:GNAT superfamily N-acetyltransferase
MSEFHRTRRHAITDITAFLGFLAGFLIAAPLTFMELKERFETGDLEATLMTFALRVLGTSLLWGIVGLAIGTALAWSWEGGYRLYRHYRPPRIEGETPRATASAGSAPVMSGSELAHAGGRAAGPGAHAGAHGPGRSASTDLAIRYETGFPMEGFLALARRIWPNTYDAALTARALDATINIGAWDGAQLVGTVRVLTDGYLFATVPEILVHPAYRRRGIGRELMLRAVEAAPRGKLFLGARPASEGFFRRIGAEPGPAGFVMRAEANREARPSPTPATRG